MERAIAGDDWVADAWLDAKQSARESHIRRLDQSLAKVAESRALLRETDPAEGVVGAHRPASSAAKGCAPASPPRAGFGIVFSQECGRVLAFRPADALSVDLGEVDEVLFMMRDFIAQCELGERLLALSRLIALEAKATLRPPQGAD